jgi:GNAT superfamily N-acetyltransferase
MHIQPLDPTDAAAVEQWHAAYAASDGHGRAETAFTWSLAEARVALAGPTKEQRQTGYVGIVDGRVVATGWLGLPLLDNRWRADVEVHVVPEARRRGHGTAMLAHLESLARAESRTSMLAMAVWPYADGPGGTGPGVAFAREHGFDLALGDVQRRLDLPVPASTLDRLADEAATRHAGYELRSWTGKVPDELVEQWADLDASVGTEAPTGDLDIEPISPDPAVVRESEDRRARQGRVSLHTVALRPDGRLAAYTEIIASVRAPRRAYQQGTLVRRTDRGHRLGLAVKVANIRRFQAELPDIRSVQTFNAESNLHMIAVNDALGFVPTERVGEFQKRLDG